MDCDHRRTRAMASGKENKAICLNHSLAPTKSCGWNVKNEEVLQYETQFTKKRENMYVFNYICKHTIREKSKISVFMHPQIKSYF